MLAIWRPARKKEFGRKDELVRAVFGHKSYYRSFESLWPLIETLRRASREPGVTHVCPGENISITMRPGSLHLMAHEDRSTTTWSSHCHPLALPKFFRTFWSIVDRDDAFEREDVRAVMVPMRCHKVDGPLKVGPYRPGWTFLRHCGIVEGDIWDGARACAQLLEHFDPNGLKIRRRKAKAAAEAVDE